MEQMALFLFLVLYGISLYTDFKYHKIKNIVTFPTMAIGLALLFIQQGGLAAATVFITAVFIGLLPEFFRIWSSGDTKLFISASVVSALLLGVSDYSLLFYFLGINTAIYLVAGHGYALYKSGFRPLVYLQLLRSNEVIGKMPGALPIMVSNILAITLYWGWPQ
jgi:hypothetical protein